MSQDGRDRKDDRSILKILFILSKIVRSRF